MFPKTPIRESGLLDVGSGQSVYWEESGRPDGIPALYLHGGPGGTLGPGGYVTKFDPERFRIIGIDQRGCGRSVPLATDSDHDLAGNTTQALIADCEQLRETLGVDRWVINGVSWGSTLALAYALEHPDRVLGIVIMAVTTTGRAEVDWITERVGAVFPEAWDRYAGHAEAAGIGYRRHESRIVEAYAKLITDPDPAVRDAASLAWAEWEDHHISLAAGLRRDPRWDDQVFRQVFVTLATHYWAADGFLEPPILARASELAGIPGTLIHGRADISGPLITAWELNRAWPDSELIIDEGEGHGGTRMVDAWAAANSRLADRILGSSGSTAD
ncbi:alpha/beta fold hydrolase [Microlunatus sp. GCM10028923]|uniref:alpha/beta fold hydrolase n=1 Tax=Microlunatus sp. GCM10028923 TaxID=3273400 RepID=UPI0036232AF5